MILISVRIENFKSIDDSGEFSIAPVTCLVGKNESGKSAILQALYKLNPVLEEDGKYDDISEYPRKTLIEYQERFTNNPNAIQDDIVTTTWSLEQHEIDCIGEILGPQGLLSTTVTVTKGYNNQIKWDIPISYMKVVEHYAKNSSLSEQEQKEAKKCQTVSELIKGLKAIEAPSEGQKQFMEVLLSAFPQNSASGKITQYLKTRLPVFVYFADYQKMPGQVSIDQLLNKKQHNTLDFSDKVFLALLDLAGTSAETIQTITQSEPLIARLEAISNRLTDEIFDYWSQNAHLLVDFRFDPGRPHDPAPFNSGYIFRTRIQNTRHRVTVSFDERSAGFVWFFSFLVWFSQVQKNYGANLIILLDEPGLSLHAKAQSDLLRYINDRLRPNHQVIYTTHSPFMIDPENLLGTRTVEDTTINTKILGTKVGDQVLSTDNDTLFPLQAALGYDITQTLFMGKHTLIVEGPGDLLYLKWFSQELKSRKREGLDLSWTITPAGGIDKISSFMALFGGSHLHIAVLTDFSEGIKKRVRSLRESELLKSGHVFSADMYADLEEADIEDIIGRQLYVNLINKTYKLGTGQKLPSKKPKEAPNRVLKEIEDYFRTLPPDIPEFDHYTPAVFIVDNSADIRKMTGLDAALDGFENLFRDINRLLPAAE